MEKVLLAEKRCSKCQTVKPRAEFHKAKDCRGGIQNECKPCHARSVRDWSRKNSVRLAAVRREWWAKNKAYVSRRRIPWKYGISAEEYDALLAAHPGCAICGSTANRLCVDHDHETGAVRGILCGLCNKMIGLAHEDEAIFLSAVEYLRKHAAVKSTGGSAEQGASRRVRTAQTA